MCLGRFVGSAGVGYCNSFSKRKTFLDSGFLAECIDMIAELIPNPCLPLS
jgi:hypothetical protein